MHWLKYGEEEVASKFILNLQVPLYMLAQLLGSILGSGTLVLLFDSNDEHFFGTAPIETATQAFCLEIVITFILMFVISGVATDSRAVQ